MPEQQTVPPAEPGVPVDMNLPGEMFFDGRPLGEVQLEDPDGVTVRLQYTASGDHAMVEGDILVGSVAKFAALAVGVVPKGTVRVGEEFRWKNGTLAYEIRAEHIRQKVELAIAHWKSKTPIQFVARTAANAADFPDFVAFVDEGVCASFVGRQGGEQTLSLTLGCTVGSAIHEIGHALGLWHEQSRPDRDQFVTIRAENVKLNNLHNFDRHTLDGAGVGEYDYGSIMHYPPKAFSKNNMKTIEAVDLDPQKRQEKEALMGQRNGPTRGDVEAIRSIYPALNWAPFLPAGELGAGG